MDQSRCTLTGTFSSIKAEDEVAEARETYLAQHPDSFWVDFGDFSFLRMDELLIANYIGGFGRIAKARLGLETLSGLCTRWCCRWVL